VNRSVNEVYHFLLPDKAMLAVRNIAEQKKAHPDETSRMNMLIKDWTAPITDRDFNILKRLSSKIDLLLKEYFQFQQSIENLTQNRGNIWGAPGAPALNLDTYEEKERLNDVRYRHDNAYFRLKMIMDYWCALWFWEYDHTKELPTREEYWSDIEAMLNVSDQELDAHTTRKLHNVHIGKDGQLGVFHEGYMNDMFEQAKLESMVASEPEPIYNTDEDSEIIKLSKEEVLAKTKGAERSFFDDSERFAIVKELADRYHFFHPMLEFLEVFWLRDGFDIICGNPPWIKLEFDEVGIISEKYPEVAIRKMSAPDVRKKRDELFGGNPQLERIYRAEETENTCSGAFLNAYQNYPLLIGQQTNLYKCVLTNGFTMMSDHGYMGLLHPETVYDDSKGQPLRNEIYHRLYYHFQYQNELILFDIGDREKYGSSIYGQRKDYVSFDSINNLFHPSTIDACYMHDGHGNCPGIKHNGSWNISGHKDRIVHYDELGLKVLCETFEENGNWHSTKLVSIHAKEILEVLESLSVFRTHVRDYPCILSEGWHETNDVVKGTIKRETIYPNMDSMQMIYSGPHMFISNPLYKTPRKVCINKADYDIIDFCKIDENFISRTNYIPCLPETEYKHLIQGFVTGQDENGHEVYNDWIDYYKSSFRLMLNQAGERTLSGGIIPPKAAHICTVISAIFNSTQLLTEFTGLTSSLVLDFFVKTIGTGALHGGRILSFPLGIADKYKSALFSRTLMLNCLTRHYADLWNECWCDEFCEQAWSIDDPRLKPFDTLQRNWTWDTPLRNYFERRQALVEIDVIAAMALGLSLKDLEMIYTIQFPVLQQNENDTWYDRKGNIVFTCSKGLTGVGVDRPQWDQIRNMQEGETYVHTIEKSELYRGQQVTYYAPFTKCDRIEDYRTAWAHFEKMFNNQKGE
jgi:hypothetical protein